MVCYTARRMNNLQVYVTIWINLSNKMSNEKSQTQNNTLYECIYTRFKNRENRSVVLEVRIAVTLGRWGHNQQQAQ